MSLVDLLFYKVVFLMVVNMENEGKAVPLQARGAQRVPGS